MTAIVSTTIDPLYLGFCIGTLFGIGLIIGLSILYAKARERLDRHLHDQDE